MSSLNIKQGSDAHFSEYPLASPSNNEIDLLNLNRSFMAGQKNGHGGRFCICLRRFTDFFHPAAKMDQLSRYYSRRSHSVAGPRKPLPNSAFLISMLISTVAVHLTCLSRGSVVSSLEEYWRSSPDVMDQLKEAKIDELDLHRAIVALSEKMKAVDDNASKKKDEPSLYTSWTLSFTAPTSKEAQTVLSGYIDYISALVVCKRVDKTSVINWRSKPSLKKNWLRIALKRKNQLDANIQRLNYSLDIANAAGIKKPVYSNGQAVKDDPDFSISLAQTVLNANWKLKSGH